jgi:hypothetical protein
VVRIALVVFALLALAGEGGASASRPALSVSGGNRHLASEAQASIFRAVPTKRCLVRHRVYVMPLLPFAFLPLPVAHFGFATHTGDSGYIMFYRSAVQAAGASARWVVEHEQQLCIPLGKTMSWCLAHLPVPGVRQTEDNVFIDWLTGPKNWSARQLVTACLR